MKITVVGLGYVGLANALLLQQKHDVVGVDIMKSKIDSLKKRLSPLKDAEIEKYLLTSKVKWSTNMTSAKDADLVIVATPTNYDDETNCFDTSSVEHVISKTLELNKDATILIRSTIPIGYVENMRKTFRSRNIIFSPEFLREGKALRDNLYPTRVIVGENSKRGKKLAELFSSCALNTPQILLTNPTEAETIKLFANTYLAVRVSFFNELDTFCAMQDIDSKSVITGVGLDPRIGMHYNNPSFGYGGYCLPKDTKQLLSSYFNIPNNVISATIKSNQARKEFVAQEIVKKKPKVVGIYRLAMKSSSDNFRHSAVIDVIRILKKSGINMVVYEPMLDSDRFLDLSVENDLAEFGKMSDIILANRNSPELQDVIEKVYTRDVFYEN